MTKTPEELQKIAEEYERSITPAIEDADSIFKHERLRSFQYGYRAGYQAAAPQWISVKDRLPDSTPIVLAMCIDGYELAYYGNYGKGQWTNTLGTEHLNVTHWMPLPKPPEEK